MATVLVSFIGNGNMSGGEYIPTDYCFDGEEQTRKTKIFGSALLQHLKDKNRQINSWLIMGTKESIWFDLVEMIPNYTLNDDENKLWELLFKNASNSDDYPSEISQENLDKWQKTLTVRLTDTNVICSLVGDATTKKSQESIFKSLLKVIQKGDEVVFDVTHGLRNQPIITSFILMYLRYLKEIKIENIEFYYASLDLKKKEGKVHQLGFCNEILKATEAVAIYEQTGNYEQIGKNLKLSDSFNTKLEKLTFLDEVNKTNPEIPNQLNDEISQANFTPLQQSLANKFKSPLHWASKETLATQLRQKAIFAFERQQYFKAVSILLEAVIVAYGEICGDVDILNNLDLHFYRDRAENELIKVLNQNENQTLKNLKKLRNAIAHGTDANGVETEAIMAREAVADENKLKQVFNDGNNLFAKIIKGEIGK
jgi:cell division protein DivIC